MKTKYIKFQTWVIISAMNILGLAACQLQDPDEDLYCAEYGCPIWEETDSAYTAQHEKDSSLKAVIQKLEQEAQEQ
ncbi:MAG: hypothetical protein K5864_02090 [Bacteroidales bacterium]|nr:hypothetical protein [Bacteroidales bacterium]